jgi:D-sedoheptulose 7-phosphate isomerase
LHGGLPCISPTGRPALNSAIANDVRADMIFAQQTYVPGRPGDVLWGISTSGNSANVVHAFHAARRRGLRTPALTGVGGGKLAKLADVVVCAPAATVVEIQEFHLPISHALCSALEDRFFPQ